MPRPVLPVRGVFCEHPMAEPLTNDLRIWLTAPQYAGLLRRAHEDERPLSAYMRRLIVRDLDESLVPHPAVCQALGGLPEGARHD